MSSLLSSSAVMAAGTVVSRLTGVVRTMLLAAALGTAVHADVFNLANTIPNTLYILVAGGVFNAVLVPQLVRAMHHDADGGEAYANRIITLGATVLTVATVALVAACPWFMPWVAGDTWNDSTATHASLIGFAQLCLPQIFFYGMYVLVGQVLNARDRFGPMMWAPIANNVVSVFVVGAYLALYGLYPADGPAAYTSWQVLLLGLGATLGIAMQFFILLPVLSRAGFVYRPRFDWRGTGLGHTFRLGAWTFGFVIANQIAFFVMMNRAGDGSHADSGVTVYSMSFLVTQVPHSIVTVSLATAMMPMLSRLAAEGRMEQVGRELSSTLRLVLAVSVPVGAALLVLGPLLANLLLVFSGSGADPEPLGWTLMAFGPGMMMFSIHYTVLRGFYSIEDTRTPFFVQCLIAGLNITGAIVLTWLLEAELTAPGLAASYGFAYLVGALTSLAVLSHRVGGIAELDLIRSLLRTLCAAVPAAVAAFVVLWGLEQAAGLTPDSRLDSVGLLVAGGLVGVATYVGLARVLRISEVTQIIGVVARRVRR